MKLPRIHLGTLLVTTFVAAILLGLNGAPRQLSYSVRKGYGWPYQVLEWPQTFSGYTELNGDWNGVRSEAAGFVFPWRLPWAEQGDRRNLAVNVAVALAMLTAVAAVCESVVRWRSRRRSP